MAKLEIVTFPDPRLKKKCEEVEEVTPEIRKFLTDMAETMYEAPGIGLAAPQVGRNIRAVVIDIGEDEETGRKSRLYKLINPEIVERKGTTEYEEGCLSIPEVRETVKRSASVVVEALDENGKELTIEASDLLAICLQHEIDHLDGVLFIDRLSTLKRELVRSQLKKARQTDESSPKKKSSDMRATTL